jgi:Tol biopolymer transport system component
VERGASGSFDSGGLAGVTSRSRLSFFPEFAVRREVTMKTERGRAIHRDKEFTQPPYRAVSAALLAIILAAGACDVHASCDVIPEAERTFRGALGMANRPFARPGDWVKLTLDPTCHKASPGFVRPASDYVVTVVFTPPAGPRNVVALATDCAALNVRSCANRPDVASATCVKVNRSDQSVDFMKLDQATIRFRFPNTDAQVLNPSDDLTFTGPATLAVTTIDQPLPCGLASSPCASQPRLVACVDSLFARDGSCGTTADDTFPSFTALPPPNNYLAVCSHPSPPCTGLVEDFRFTVDAAGNLLIPMDWEGTFVERDAVPVGRLLHSSAYVEAFAGRRVPIWIPDQTVLGSFSTNGRKLPPLFDPTHDPSEPGTLAFFGTADAPATVLRIARHLTVSHQCSGGMNQGLPCTDSAGCPDATCGPPTCAGGSNAALQCDTDSNCPGGACGPGLFDFSTRLAAGVGPVTLRLSACIGGPNELRACADSSACPGGQCGGFVAEVLNSVPLDGFNQSEAVDAFVKEEKITNEDLNGDGDTTDHVVTLVDRATGVFQPIGDLGVEGRAVVRVQQPPFSFPAVAVEGGVLAFLESEPMQGAIDANGNGDVFDSILRVFHLGPGGALNVTGSRAIAADAAPLLNGRSLIVSSGLVFLRASEAAGAHQTTERISVGPNGAEADQWSLAPALSADGRFVAFISSAGNLLVEPDTNGNSDVFVHDRILHTTERVSVGPGGSQGDDRSTDLPAISADGRFVAFRSDAKNLVLNDTNSASDVFVHDRCLSNGDPIQDCTPSTELVSVSSAGDQGRGDSASGVLSADGRFVAFSSVADNLVPGDTNAAVDVFVRDRCFSNGNLVEGCTTNTELVSADATGVPGSGTYPAISADGRFVAFASTANLVANDKNGGLDIFVRDRCLSNGDLVEGCTPNTELVSVDSRSVQGNGDGDFRSAISADGRFVAFAMGTAMVPGDTNGLLDVFVRDRQIGVTQRISEGLDGAQADSFNYGPALSADGRYVAFLSDASNLVSGDTNGASDLFVHDRLTGATQRVNVNSSGAAARTGTGPGLPKISADGRFVAFQSDASDLVASDLNGVDDVFVRGVDSADMSADLFPDGKLDDTVLEVLDASSGVLTTLCPAADVAVADGKAAFLRPEAAVGTAACPGGSLNGDSDTNDLVVQLWPGSGPVMNLGLAAVAVSMSDAYISALVSEAAEGTTDLNGDGDTNDTVVEVHPVDGGVWANTRQAADMVQLCGSLVAFITPEAAQGADLNNDGDRSDRVLQLYDPSTDTVINLGQAAEEFVCGPSLLAFRTREADQHGQDMNGDGDATDDVLQIYDIGRPECRTSSPPEGCLINTQQAVTPCRSEACDPRVPYRVLKDTVTFLTLEGDQREDLNGDGDKEDLVIQTFNVRIATQPATTALTAEPGRPQKYARTSVAGGSIHAGPLTTIGSVSAGICTDTGRACATSEGCGRTGTCFVPPGDCILDSGKGCDPQHTCDSDQFCQPLLGTPAQGTCRAFKGHCRSTSDCAAPAGQLDRVKCDVSDQNFNRLLNPLMSPPTQQNTRAAAINRRNGGVTTPTTQTSGASVFIGARLGARRCVVDLGTACEFPIDCPAEESEFCEVGTCHREHGACHVDGDCPQDEHCGGVLLVQTAEDADGDEIPDAFDNCPQVPNILQEDSDEDGVGDACSAVPQQPCSGDADCDDGTCVRGCVQGRCGSKFRSDVSSCLAQLIPGGGAGMDCTSEWFVAGAAVASTKQVCIDNDPRCDFDPWIGQCAFRVATCLNAGGTGGACPSPGVKTVTLKAPQETSLSGFDAANAASLVAAIADVATGQQGEGRDAGTVTFTQPVTAANQCSALVDFRVPLWDGGQPALHKTTQRLKVETATAAAGGGRGAPVDRDTLALTCLPCVKARTLSCRVEGGQPVVVLPDICGRRVLADTVNGVQPLECGEAPPACAQSHTVQITRRTPAAGALESFEAILDPVVENGKLRGKKCRSRLGNSP